MVNHLSVSEKKDSRYLNYAVFICQLAFRFHIHREEVCHAFIRIGEVLIDHGYDLAGAVPFCFKMNQAQ